MTLKVIICIALFLLISCGDKKSESIELSDSQKHVLNNVAKYFQGEINLEIVKDTFVLSVINSNRIKNSYSDSADYFTIYIAKKVQKIVPKNINNILVNVVELKKDGEVIVNEERKSTSYFYNLDMIKQIELSNLSNILAENYLRQANDFYTQGKYDYAVIYYDKSKHYNGQNIDVYLNKGSTLSTLGKYDEAIKEFNTTLIFDSNSVIAYNNLGNAYNAKKEYLIAIENFDKAISIDSLYFKAFYNKGNVFKDMYEYKNAIEQYNIAIKLNSEIYNNAFFSRGVCYMELKINDKACADFKVVANEFDNLPNEFIKNNCPTD